MLYFKRCWEESTGDPLTDAWGTSTYYFETDENAEVLRQVQLFENGNKLKYDQIKMDDEIGGLSDVDLDFEEFAGCKIGQLEFEEIWNSDGTNSD